MYHVDKILRETGKVVDDSLHEIFVDKEVDDDSDIAEYNINDQQERSPP